MLNPEYSLKVVWESGVFPLCHHSFENFPPQFDFVCLEEVGPIIPEIFVWDQLSSCQLLQSPPARLNRAPTTELWLYHTRLIILILTEISALKQRDKKPNSWTCNLVEVSGHNLESSQFLYGCLKPYGRGYGFLSGFPPFSFTEYSNWTVEILKRLREFEEIHQRLSDLYKIKIWRQSFRDDE